MEGRFRLVAGLGNPGREYERTRHNVGFLVAEALAHRAGAGFAHEPKWNADVARAGEVTFMKPMTFMNLSGESVGDFCHFFKLEPSQALIVIDDVALPLGRLRMRGNGSDGGHNGLESVLMHLGTAQVPRLRVGIGIGKFADGGAKDSLTGHVLGKFSAAEQPALDEAVGRAADAIEFAQANGLEAAMNKFNPKENKAS
ncbi:MAG: aminoacyl-tRNA hydrolase [Chthoniobacterales bacterium]